MQRNRYVTFLMVTGLVSLCASGTHAQYLPPYVLRALDSALAAMAMTRSDVSMRWDAVADDPHRLGVVKRLFGDPLASFSVADSLASVALTEASRPISFFEKAFDLLDLDRALVTASRALPTDRDLRVTTGIDFDSVDFTTSILLRRYLSLAVATDAATVSTRGVIPQERLMRILDYCDSLMLQSEGDAGASLVDMRLAERYSIARSKQHFNIDLKGIDYGRLAAPGVVQFLMALDMARSMQSEISNYRDTLRTRIWTTPLGRVALGGGGDDSYDGEFFVIVDLGGSDVYKTGPRSKRRAFDRPVNLIVDFSGNDTYIGGDYVFGGSLFGSSTLIDLGGDDDYSARDFALGCGFFGTSVLYDGGGSDRYSGGTCVQGAGAFGIGLLIDLSGNDLYHAHLTSQGYGYTRGLGVVADVAGNDQYIANSPYTDYLRYDDHFETFCQGASLGSRPVASAGIGIIAEGAGSDLYSGDIFAQGTAYWFGLGAIVDKSGNDAYNAYQYSQGSGVHLAFGVVVDTSGNDNYVSHGVSQGCGHDIGFGGLYDAKGDDNYVVESLSLGGGNADALSLFIDGGGEDGYIARRDNTMGYSDLRREYGMIGLFLDLERKDFYGTARGGNDTMWLGSYYGVGIDGDIRPKDTAAARPGQAGSEKTAEEIARELARDVPTLFIQASAAPQKYQYLVEPARKRLVEMADSSLPYLLGMLNTESPREALALGIILPRIGMRAMPALIDTALHGDISRVGRAIYALGEMKDTAAALAIAERLVDSTISWRLKSIAGEAALKLRSRRVLPYLRKAMRDSIELIRGYATRAFVMVADSGEIVEALSALDDPSQIVRYQYQLALQRRGIDSIAGPFIAATLMSKPGFPRKMMLAQARALRDSAARNSLLTSLLQRADVASRMDAVELVRAWNDSNSRRQLEHHRRAESSSSVRESIDELFKTGNGSTHAPLEPRPSQGMSDPKGGTEARATREPKGKASPKSGKKRGK